MALFIGGTGAYVLLYTVYVQSTVATHWLVWTATMFFCSVLVLEPLLIFWNEVVWCALVANFAQYWGFGSHALAATTKYREIVRQVETLYLSRVKVVAAVRIQRWWLTVLEMYKAIHQQTTAAVKLQAI